MSLDLGKIGYKVFIDDREYRTILKRMEAEAAGSSENIGGIFRKLAGYLGVGVLFWKSMAGARAFSKELANLQSIADDLDMSKIRTEILGLDARLGSSAELTNALYYAYSAGVRGTEAELVKFTAQVSQLAQTVGSGVTPVMDALTTMMNAYGLSVKDTGKLTDWFYSIVKAGKTTGPELAQSLGQIAATAASSGIKIEDLGAALATLTTTMPTNIAVTSLAASIRTLLNPTDETRKAAEALGLDMSAAAIRAKGFGAVMQDIYDKTQGKADIIAKLFPAESSRAIMSLAGTQIQTLNQNIKDFGNNAGDAAKGFSAIAASDAKKWDAMLIVAQKLGTAFGDMTFKLLTLGGALNGFYDWLYKLNASSIQTIAKIGALVIGIFAFNKAISMCKMMLISLTVESHVVGSSLFVFRAGVRAASIEVGLFSKANMLLVGTLRALKIAFMTNPITAILAVIGIAISGMIYLTDRANQKAQQLLDDAKAKMEDARAIREAEEKKREENTPKLNRLEELKSKQSLNTVEMREAEGLIRSLNNEYGDFGLVLDKTTGKIIDQTDAIRKYREELKNRNLDKLKEEEKQIQATIKIQEKNTLNKSSWGYSSLQNETNSQYEAVKTEYEKKFNNGKKITFFGPQGRDPLQGRFLKEAEQRAREKLLSNNKDLKDLKSKLEENQQKQQDVLSDEDLKKIQFAKDKIRLEDAEASGKRIMDKWKDSDLTDNDRRKKQIEQEYAEYKKTLDVRKELGAIKPEEYEKLNAEARARRDLQIKENEIDRQNALNMLKAQEKAYADGILSDEEKLLLKKEEILAQQRKIVELERQLKLTTSTEKKEKLELELAKARAGLGQSKGEYNQMKDDKKYSDSEERRNIQYEEFKVKLAGDGSLSDMDNIRLKQLEISQQSQRIAELEQRRNEAKTQELKNQLTLQIAQARSKKSQLEFEAKQMKDDKVLKDAEDKRSKEMLELQIKNRADGILSTEEKRAEMQLEIDQQKQRVQELTKKAAGETNADLKKQAEMAVLQARNALSNLVVEQNKLQARTTSQGSFSASVLAMMNENPIDKQQLEKLRQIEKNTKDNKLKYK